MSNWSNKGSHREGRHKVVRLGANLPMSLNQLVHRIKYTFRSALVGDREVPGNLAGDRDIEWSWVASHMPSSSGEALDFGPGMSPLGLIAAQRGFNVTAIDLEPVQWPYVHPRLRFVWGDILKLPL